MFKSAVKNRRSGEWEAVPMCAMNQQRWSEVYEERLHAPILAREAQASAAAPASVLEPALKAAGAPDSRQTPPSWQQA